MTAERPTGGKKAWAQSSLGSADTLNPHRVDPIQKTVDQASEESGGVASTHKVLKSPSRIRGESVGRFLLIDRLGEGGMGTVLLGYDPVLNRRVAIKVLKGSESDSAVERLVREAQAMAKIHHPNVVTVFDAGTQNGQVFIAMEFVEGGTFRDWTLDKRRSGGPSWQEVLEIMVGAGQGLVAAHERQLVHRDFKPENILISKAGEIKVADFGLVGVNLDMDASVDPGKHQDPTADAFSSSSNRLTVEGALLGTPFYMAPEQFDGTGVDAKADQFAFCVVLYEALYGLPPYTGDSLVQLASNARNMKFAALPAEVGIPSWLRNVVLRGLAPKAEDRFPSMKALVHELVRDRKNRAARFALVAALVVGAGATAWAMKGEQSQASATCHDSQEQLVGTWDKSVERAIKEAFDKSGASYADAAWKTVHENLDARGAAWVSMRTESCEATRVYGTQSAELMDRRMACLERQRLEMSALTKRLTSANADAIKHAAEAVLGLGDLDHCSLAVVVRSGVGEIIDPSLKPKVQSLHVALSEAKAMTELGQYAEAMSSATTILASAEEIEFFSVAAEAALLIGESHWRQGEVEQSVDWFLSSAVHADRADSQLVRLQSLSMLIYVIGWELAQVEEAQRWGEVAEGIIVKFGIEGFEKGLVQGALGATDLRARRFESAQGRITEALTIYQETGHRLPTANALSLLGALATYTGKLDEALDYHQQALRIRVDALGAAHPDASESLNNIGSVYLEQGKYAEARETLQESLRLAEAAFGNVHPDIADPVNNLGAVDFAEGNYEGAIAYFERAIAIVENTMGMEHLDLAIILSSAGRAYLLLDRPAEAITALERALGILREHRADSEQQADVEFPLARALASSGNRKRARQLAEEALLAYQSNADLAELAAEVSEWLAEL